MFDIERMWYAQARLVVGALDCTQRCRDLTPEEQAEYCAAVRTLEN